MQSFQKLVLLLLLAISILCQTSIGFSQTSASVPTNDPAYEWIKILAGAGIVKTDFPEQLPWDRLEFARLIREAKVNYAHLEQQAKESISLNTYARRLSKNRFVRNVLEALEIEFSDVLNPQKTIHLEALNRAYIQTQYIGQTPQPTFNDGLGSTSGVFHPLINYPEGRHYIKGGDIDIQTQHWLQLGKYFTLVARPQLELTIPTTGGMQANIYAKTLAGKIGWKNIELVVGREQVAWMMSPHGGGLFSDNSRGLDQIQLNTPYPWHLPWVFKKLGEFKFSTFFTNLGPQYTPEYAWMTASQLVWHITPNIRIGAAHQFTFNGEGIQPTRADVLFFEYLGIPTNTTGATVNATNNRSYIGFGAFRMPFLRNTEIGFEWYLEDKNFSTASALFHYQSAYRGWLLFPDLSGNSRWQALFDFNYVGPIPYRHSIYTSGWALNTEFMAQTYGSDTQSLRSSVGYLISPYSKIFANFSFIRRLGNTYAGVNNAAGEAVGYTEVSSGPTETHYLGMLSLQNNLGKGFILNTQAGIDFIRNAYFQAGNSINPGLVKINLSWYPYLRHY